MRLRILRDHFSQEQAAKMDEYAERLLTHRMF
jgi:hypothetical protein